MISDKFYLNQQNKIKSSKAFGFFWAMWAIYSSLLFVAIAFYFFAIGSWKIIAAGFLAALFARYVICEAIAVFKKKMHPYQRLNFQPPTSWLFSFSDSRPDAFPSQHTAFFAACLPAIWHLNSSLGLAALLIVIMISWARIVVGYHDFVDVAAGWVLGLLWGFLTLYLGARFW